MDNTKLELMALSIRLREVRRQAEGLMTDIGMISTDVDRLIVELREGKVDE